MIKIEILLAKDALLTMANPDFTREWEILANKTSGFTILQEQDFVITWYKHYAHAFEPLIIIGKDEDKNLLGFMPLAQHKTEHYITHAGEYYAEYHGWLSLPEYSSEFLAKALIAIKDRFSVKKWQWQWIPPHLSAEDLVQLNLQKHGIYLQFAQQDNPEWNLLDESKLKKTLKSSSLKSKINRLKKRGDYRFEVIDSSERIREVLQIAQYQCDFRKEAVNNVRPFADDPHNLEFSSSLYKDAKGVHASALWLDQKLLAFHLGTNDGERVILGLITFDPTEFKSSPGSILLAELAKSLTAEGYKTFDITPGKDGYKNRYANAHTPLYKPVIYFSQYQYFKSVVVDKSKQAVEQVLKILTKGKTDLSLLKTRVQDSVDKLKNLRIGNLAGLLFKRMSYHILEINPSTFHADLHDSGSQVKVQAFEDLLKYEGKAPYINRRSLLIEAMDKFRKQEQLYSVALESQLQCSGWVRFIKEKTTILKMEIPENSYLLYDFYVSDTSEAKHSFSSLVEKMLQDISADKNKKIFLLASRNHPLPSRLRDTEKIHSITQIKSFQLLSSLQSIKSSTEYFNTAKASL